MSTQKKLIQLVDDDPSITEPIRHRLEEDGWEVSVSSDGEKGLHSISRSLPTLAVLDLVMPNMTGIELLRALRANEKTSSLPVIILSSLPQSRHGEELQSLGVQMYLNKLEVDLEDIITHIEQEAKMAMKEGEEV